MKRFAQVFALAALVLPAIAQQQPFQEQIDVNAVLLDVIVTDTKGNQILGLGKDDFIVKEDGVAQPVETVDYFTNRRLLDQREENAPFKVERVREDRYFIFFFDKPQDQTALFDRIQHARKAVQHFIREEMQPTDLVAIAGHDMRLKVYSDFTSDKKQLERALNDALKFGKGVTSASASASTASIMKNIDTTEMMNGTGTVYEGLGLLADALRPIRARKNLVLFSPGIMDHRESARGGLITNRSPEFDAMLESLNASNVTAYPVQLQQAAMLSPVVHQRLSETAQETGGQYFQFNVSFEPVVEKVENANSGYYLVSYSAKKPRGTVGYQKVHVTVKNPEFRVVARSGYQFGG